MKASKGYKYNWVIVFASAVLLAFGIGMFFSTNSVFVKPICDSLNFSRGEFTLYRTIITLVGGVTMPFYGRFIQKIGVKRIIVVCAVALSVIVFLYSFATSLLHFYLLAAINGLFFNGIGFMSIGVLVSTWFEGKRGLATGIAYAGSGLGGAIMVPLVGWIIEQSSWQWAYRFMGVLGLLVLLPVALFIIKNKPSDVGLQAVPQDEAQGENISNQAVSSSGLTMKEAFRTTNFWLLAIGFFLINTFAGAANTHSAPYLSDIGYETGFVSTVISVFMLFLTVGKIILGLVYDRFGAFSGNTIVCVFALLFPVFALLASNPVMPWAYALSVGIASCGVSVPVSILVMRYFGSRDFPAIFSFFSMVTALAPSISVPAMGAVYDSVGTYRPAWVFLLFSSVIITVCMTGAELIYRKNIKVSRQKTS